jgi:chromosome segregation ATPase
VTLADFKEWFTIAAGLGGLVVTAFVWRLKGEFASKGDMAETRTRLDTLEGDVTKMSARLETLPDHEDLSDVRERLASMEGAIKVASEQVEGLRQVMVRLERPLNQLLDHHMNRGR